MACCSGIRSIFRSTSQARIAAKTCHPLVGCQPKGLPLNGVRCVSMAKRPSNKPKEKPIPGYQVSVIKGFDSQHTGSIKGSFNASERLLDDIMIRKYIKGVFYTEIASEIIIKRRDNRIFLVFLIKQGCDVNRVYFLTGMSEKLLSNLFGCIVKFELQSEE